MCVFVAFLVFLAAYFIAKGVRRTVRRLTEQRRRHRNVGLVVGRLAQGFIVFLGLMVGLVIALPTFKPAQLIELLGISSVARRCSRLRLP